MSEDCHDSDNMPTHRLQATPAHTCRQDRNQPCEACAVFAPFRRQVEPYRAPESTAAPELDLTGLDLKWLAGLRIKVTKE